MRLLERKEGKRDKMQQGSEIFKYVGGQKTIPYAAQTAIWQYPLTLLGGGESLALETLALHLMCHNERVI